MKCFFKGKYYIILLIMLIIGACLFLPQDAEAGTLDKPTEVLIINSYSQGLIWTHDEADGIIDTLKDSGINFAISVEYMDWKNYPTEENLQYLTKYYANKYQDKKIDMIITTDDAALEFALKNRLDMFSNAPVVFCGVNQEGIAQITAGYDNVTGVSEQIHPKETIQLAIDVIPNLENIYVIYDDTESGISTGQLVLDTIKEVDPKINGRSIHNITHGEMLNQVKSLPENSAILVTTYYADVNGDNLDFEQVSKMVSEASKVPVFHLYDFGMGNGAIGGCLLSGKQQGERAAEIALRILQGEALSSIPILMEDTCRRVFDYEQLMRFHIPLNRIDKNSEIINKPFSFYETYKSLVLITVGIILLLSLFVIILSIYIKKLKITDKELQDRHEELTQIYEELTASEEEIKQQCDELTENRESLMQSEERYRLVSDGANDLIWDVDMTTLDIFYSDRWYDVLGYDRDEFMLTVNLWNQLIHPDDKTRFNKATKDYMDGEIPYYSMEYRMKTKSGDYKWFYSRGKLLRDSYGNAVRFAGSLTDITELKLVQEMLEYRAYNDSLTGLPNRQYLNEVITKNIESNKQSGMRFAVFFIDTDNFKLVNDVLGHDIGDRLLVKISDKLIKKVKNASTHIFRLGGDEFIIMMENLKEDYLKDIEALATKVLEVFSTPFVVDANKLHITCSIGISIYPDDSNTLDELMRNADTAMYKAKEEGKNKFLIYEQSFHKRMVEKLLLEESLRNALKKKEFLLFYQPQVELRNNKICGFEALLRWNSAKDGFISPNIFISAAEECGIIVPLGEWVLREACLFMKKLHDQGYSDLHISVNISIVQLIQESFVDMVQNVLHDTKLSPNYLILEITESILMESFEDNIIKLNTLRDMGVRIALDDFGKGYSSLSYLMHLPISTLKIDKSFVDYVCKEDKTCITGTIVMIGHQRGLEVIAEGVETEEQLRYLQRFDCDIIQGYLFSKPVPEEQVYELLA